MKETINQKIVLDLFIIIAGFAILFLIGKICLTIINEKRLKAFSLDSKETEITSIGDFLKNIFRKFIKRLTKLVKKSSFLTSYGNSFEKHLIYDENSFYNCLDIVSIKIFMMIFCDLLYLISTFIKLSKFNVMIFMFSSIIGFFIIDFLILFLYKRKKGLIEEQLLQAVVIMNNAFKSGKNIMQAVKIVEAELPNPIKDEFKIISKDISYGLDLTVVFDRFAGRVKVPEAKYITSSLSLLSKTGGNIVTVFNMIERTFYERLKIKNELHSLTSASRFLYKMLLIMPPIFVFAIVLFNPTYFNPLISTTIGFITDGVILVLYVLYILLVKKVVKVEEVWK